ncbi:hypothetical protein DPSP01_001129 [Paraphaeosphaeria sporulosa]
MSVIIPSHLVRYEVPKVFDNLRTNLRVTLPHPKPGTKSKVDFCKYWKGTWDTLAFIIAAKGLEHVTHQYPGKDFQNEFLWLQKDVNALAKQKVGQQSP